MTDACWSDRGDFLPAQFDPHVSRRGTRDPLHPKSRRDAFCTSALHRRTECQSQLEANLVLMLCSSFHPRVTSSTVHTERMTHNSIALSAMLCFVGAAGFEPATPCTPSKCATGLRYAPCCFHHSCCHQDRCLLAVVSNPVSSPPPKWNHQ
jgi:hypothetical protein